MAGRELIRELHEASYRRLVIELLAQVGGLARAEAAARDAFAAAYRDDRSVDTALSPHDELRRLALDAIHRRERRRALLERLRLRRSAEPTHADPDARLSPEAQTTLEAVVALPASEREAVVLSALADLPDA